MLWDPHKIVTRESSKHLRCSKTSGQVNRGQQPQDSSHSSQLPSIFQHLRSHQGPWYPPTHPGKTPPGLGGNGHPTDS